MLYRLEMGTIERAIIQRHEVTKEAFPERIAKAPQVELGLNLYWEGFLALSSCRSAAYSSEGPIPWIAMRDYCEDCDITGDQRQDFYILIGEMDKTYLDFKTKKMKKDMEPK